MNKICIEFGKSQEVLLGDLYWVWLLAHSLELFICFAAKQFHFQATEKGRFFLSLAMCLVLFVVPFVKYPGNPPAVGNPDTIWLRESMYIGFLSVSALSALYLGILSYNLRYIQKAPMIIPLFYVVVISVAFVLFPPNPDKISIPMDLVNSFRVMSGLTMVGFWLALGVIFGFYGTNTNHMILQKLAQCDPQLSLSFF